MKRTPREAAERIIAGYREVCTMTPHVPCVPEDSSDNAVILAVAYLAEHPPEGTCEHGVIAGDWCEPCNVAMKQAIVENMTSEREQLEGFDCRAGFAPATNEQPTQYRCNLCGGLVKFDGTKPGNTNQ